MTHVGLLIPTLDRIAGAERQVILLARGLSRRGWRVTVITLSGDGTAAADELSQTGASFRSLKMRKGLADPRGWIQLHHWIRSEQPDVLHAHLPHATWLARWSRRFAPTRVLVDSVHTSATGTLGRRLGYRYSDRLSDRVVAVSDGAGQAYQSAGLVASTHLSILPNGVDVDHWRPDPLSRSAMRNQLGLSNEFLWLAAGRLDPVKDYPSLLWAMMEVPLSTRLIIAGAGSTETQLRKLAREYGIESCVRFLGFESDLRPWMHAADAFVLSSRGEGLPMSLLEAGASALPAVATDVPGCREIIVHGQTGYLATACSSLALRNAMTRMIRLSASDRSSMGQNARLRVLQHFSLNTVLDRWEALYHELLDRRPSPSRRGSLL